MQISAEQLRALDIISAIQLLIHGMGRVGGAAHGQEQHILPGSLLERECDGDAAALARQIGLHVPDVLDCLAGGGEIPVSWVGNPPFAGVLQGAGDLALGAER